jgi:excisionase family DNA binding protein
MFASGADPQRRREAAGESGGVIDAEVSAPLPSSISAHTGTHTPQLQQMSDGQHTRQDGMETSIYDKAGAAEYLGTTQRHIERLWSERKLGGRKVGRFVRFTEKDLDDFLERQRVPALNE